MNSGLQQNGRPDASDARVGEGGDRAVRAAERDPLTNQIIGAAIEVHRHLGPGLLESAYEECLAWELTAAGLSVARQVPLPVVYKGVRLEAGYRLDLVVNSAAVVELKTVDALLPVHKAQLLTYL